MKKSILIFILITSFLACKKEKKEIENNTSDKIDTKDQYPNFTVKLKAKVELDDQFRLLYTDDLGEEFSPQKIVFKEVKGSKEYQIIEFVLKEPEIYPARVRLNIGMNKEQKKIDIDYIEFFHDEGHFVVQDSLFHRYFFPNKNIKLNEMNGEIELKLVDGNYFPFFVSRKPLHEKLEEL